MHAQKIPELTLPFGVAGAVAGWVTAGALANPLVALAPPHLQEVSATCGAFSCAVIGAWATRALASKGSAAGARLGLLVRTSAALALTGAITGVVVRSLSGVYLVTAFRSVAMSAMAGLLGAVAWMPGCALAVAAAARSARARPGSIVAVVDRRALGAAFATGVGGMTLFALVDWPSEHAMPKGEPLLPLLIACACALLLAAIVACDVVTLVRVRRALGAARASDLESTDGEAERADLDLGLGEALVRKVERGHAYRSQEQTVLLVHGDPLASTRALARAARGAGAGLLWLVVVIGLHALAASARVELAVDALLCGKALSMRASGRRNAREHCRAGAGIAQELGDDRALPLAHLACALGDDDGCARSAEVSRLGGRGPTTSETADGYLRAACLLGRNQSCIERACAPLRRDERFCNVEDESNEECLRARLKRDWFDEPGLHDLPPRCAGGDASLCEDAAKSVEDIDARLAAALLARGCDLGRSWSCYAAGNAYAELAGEPSADSTALALRATALHAEGCSRGIGLACCEAARFWSNGPLELRDEARATELYQRSANAHEGDFGACDSPRKAMAPHNKRSKHPN